MPVKLGRSWSKVVDNLVKKVIIVQSTVRRIRIRHDGRLEVSLERVIAISDHERLPRNECLRGLIPSPRIEFQPRIPTELCCNYSDNIC